MEKIHLCESCSETESCDWFKYCQMNTVVCFCEKYVEKGNAKVLGSLGTKNSKIPIWDSSILYESGTKVLFRGKEGFVFGGVGEKPSRFMPNVKFKISDDGDVAILKSILGNTYWWNKFWRTHDDGRRCFSIQGDRELDYTAYKNINLPEVSIYEAIPELVPEGMRYNKEFKKLVPDVLNIEKVLETHDKIQHDIIKEYYDGINLENDIGRTSTSFENKYDRKIIGKDGGECIVDVYDVLKAFEVKCPALQHLIKKALCAGLRGHKDIGTDLQDIIDSATRAKELYGKDHNDN